MRWLKFIVILLGVLIVFGMGLLGLGFYKKTADPDWKLFGSTSKSEEAAVAPSSPPRDRREYTRQPLPEFGDVALDIPADCHIASVASERRRLIVTLGPKATCRRAFVIDMLDGRVLGSVFAKP